MSSAHRRAAKHLNDYTFNDLYVDDELHHELRIIEELSDIGFGFWQLRRAESKYIASIIGKDEHILSAIYGHVPSNGKAVLVATDLRVIYLDHVPIFEKLDEFPYDSITGITYSINVFMSKIILHTTLGDRTLEHVKHRTSESFVNYIEAKCTEQREYESTKQDKMEK